MVWMFKRTFLTTKALFLPEVLTVQKSTLSLGKSYVQCTEAGVHLPLGVKSSIPANLGIPSHVSHSVLQLAVSS